MAEQCPESEAERDPIPDAQLGAEPCAFSCAFARPNSFPHADSNVDPFATADVSADFDPESQPHDVTDCGDNDATHGCSFASSQSCTFTAADTPSHIFAYLNTDVTPNFSADAVTFASAHTSAFP
jgi:hypothetical protein